MKLIDRLLRRVGLLRRSQIPYERMTVTWPSNEPCQVDIKFKNGQRVAGAVDPWWPNKPPLLTYDDLIQIDDDD